MKHFLALAVAIAAVSFLSESNANAQGFNSGYQFGSGIQSSCGFGGLGFIGATPREQPPYFAKFPPVYYSHIVKRPYGISPYAAPAGIAPVEMSYPAAAPAPVTVTNPFFKSTPEKVPDSKQANTEDVMPVVKPAVHKTTWVSNPFAADIAQR